MPRRPRNPGLDTQLPVAALPERPSLEYERKRAKRLLRDLRAAQSEPLERARLQRIRPGGPAAGWKLADVQLLLAREYGFSSWPRLVEHFSIWERHHRAGPMRYSVHRHSAESRVRGIMQAHRERRPARLGSLAAFVPRFFGLTDDEILATPLTENEARLAAARELRFPSWAALVAFLDQVDASTSGQDERTGQIAARAEGSRWVHLDQVAAATRANDREALARVLEAHPELLGMDPPAPKSLTLLQSALHTELRERTPEARAKSDWLVSRGADLVGTLNRMLTDGPIPGPNARTEEVAYLLERGADPAWVAPNGMSVLEHALLRYWNPEAVELIASRVTPPRAFWIAAGLGDVAGMLEFLGPDGAPTEAARRRRPDFIAAGIPSPPCRPDADGREIVWEAFLVAGMNQRFAALDALLDRGLPVDHAPWGGTLLEWAEGNARTVLVDYLVKRGARRG